MNPHESGPNAAPPTTASPSLAEVVARLAAEVAPPLTQALERVQILASSGRIDRSGLDALREEIRQARQAGLRSQQIARLVAGQAQPTLERVSLAAVLGAALADQAAEAGPLAPTHRPALTDLAVMGDATLIHRLLRTAADWAGAAARSALVWTLDLQPRPLRARLRCQFAPQRLAPPAQAGTEGPAADAPDTLDWLLLQFTAHLAGVTVQRDWGAAQCTLTLEFAHTIAPATVADGAAPTAASGSGGGLAAGGQVLVLAARREARQLVREALRGHDLFVDYVSTVAAARDYCAEGLPQALIYEAGFAGDALQGLLAALAAAPRTVARVEISPQGQDHEVAGASARVGVDGLRHTLPAVLAMALARRG